MARVLFLCTHNSVRSQMAQGLLHALAPEHYSAFSAGTHPSQVHPLAVKVMAELGINILPQGVHQLQDYVGQSFDLVVTVCDSAAEECPAFPGAAHQLHWSFADPSLARGDEAQRLSAFRHTRDLILVRLRQWLRESGYTPEPNMTPVVSIDSPQAVAANIDHAEVAALRAATPEHVLVLGTNNAVGSQITEAWIRFLGGMSFEVVSAGTHPTVLHPLTIQVMGERGIDISQQNAKSVVEFLDHPFDVVITVGEHPTEVVPDFAGPALRVSWSILDPLTVEGDAHERLRAFRDVRDALYFEAWQWITERHWEET